MTHEHNGALQWKAPAFIFILTSVIVLALRFTYYGLGYQSPAAELAISVVIQNVLLVGAILYYMKRRVHLPLAAIDLRPIGAETVRRSIFWGVGFVICMNGLMFLLNWILPKDIPAQSVETIFSIGPTRIAFPVSLFVMAVVAPIAEELFFRGLLFHSLPAALGERGAMLITSLCFGLAHGDIYRLMPLTLAGYFFQVLAKRSGSIVASMIAHGVWNGLTVVFAFVYVLPK